MSDWWYYDFMNPDHALRTELLNCGCAKWVNFRMLHNLVDMRTAMFSYENLPGKLTSQIMETAIMFGQALCFYRPPGIGEWLLCKWQPAGDRDWYNKPVLVNVNTLTGVEVGHQVPYDLIVEVRDNRMGIPPFLYIQEYMRQIDECEKAINKMLKVGTLPVMLVGNRKVATQMKQVAKRFGDEEPFIASDDTLPDSVRSFDIKPTIDPLDIYELKQKYYTECVQALGIYDVPQKHERMLVKELADQNDFVDTIYTESRDERQRFLTELERRGGPKVTLIETYRSNWEDTLREVEDQVRVRAETIKEIDPDANVNQGGGF